MKTKNPDCEGTHCESPTGDVRKVRVGSSPHHGNMILCEACHSHEMRYRRDLNRHLDASAQFPLPVWDALEVYATA